MHPLSQKSLLLEYGGPALLTLGIFLLDLSLPPEYAVWLVYAIPLALTATSSRAGAPRFGVGLVALLIVIGAIASPEGVLPVSSWINRLLGTGLMAACVFLMKDRRNNVEPARPMTLT